MSSTGETTTTEKKLPDSSGLFGKMQPIYKHGLTFGDGDDEKITDENDKTIVTIYSTTIKIDGSNGVVIITNNDISFYRRYDAKGDPSKVPKHYLPMGTLQNSNIVRGIIKTYDKKTKTMDSKEGIIHEYYLKLACTLRIKEDGIDEVYHDPATFGLGKKYSRFKEMIFKFAQTEKFVNGTYHGEWIGDMFNQTACETGKMNGFGFAPFSFQTDLTENLFGKRTLSIKTIVDETTKFFNSKNGCLEGLIFRLDDGTFYKLRVDAVIDKYKKEHPWEKCAPTPTFLFFLGNDNKEKEK
jgi:hypothetical protein